MDVTNAVQLAESICTVRSEGAMLRQEAVKNSAASLDDEDVGTYKDFNDLKYRVNDGAANNSSLYLQDEAQQFLSFAPEKFFEVSITGESMGITHTVKAVAIVQDSKVRYLRWQEDP
jgi:hypothetical protein